MKLIGSTSLTLAMVLTLGIISGCDRVGLDRASVDEPSTVIELGPGAPADEKVRQAQGNASATSQPRNIPGEIEITHDNGVLAVTQVEATPDDVLRELSKVAGFDFEGHAEGLQEPVRYPAYHGSIEDFLRLVLDGRSYLVGYSDGSSSALPRIESLHLRPVRSSEPADGRNASFERKSSVLAGSAVVPDRELPVYRDVEYADPDGTVYSDAADTEQVLAEIQEMDLNLAGLNQLEQLYTSSPNADVRREVVNTLADSDGYSSRRIILGALGDGNDSVVMTALEAIDIWQDPSVVPFIEPLTQRSDNTEISELAREIVEFNSDDDMTLVKRKTPAEIARSRLLTDANMQQARSRRDRQRVDRSAIVR